MELAFCKTTKQQERVYLPKVGLEPPWHRMALELALTPNSRTGQDREAPQGRGQRGRDPNRGPAGEGGARPKQGPRRGRGETPKGPTRARGARPQRAPPGEDNKVETLRTHKPKHCPAALSDSPF